MLLSYFTKHYQLHSNSASFLFTFTKEFFLQAMWAAPLSQHFLHLLYDKEILEEYVILQWYSREPTGGEDSGFEPQRKQLRQQVGRILYTIMLNSATSWPPECLHIWCYFKRKGFVFFASFVLDSSYLWQKPMFSDMFYSSSHFLSCSMCKLLNILVLLIYFAFHRFHPLSRGYKKQRKKVMTTAKMMNKRVSKILC